MMAGLPAGKVGIRLSSQFTQLALGLLVLDKLAHSKASTAATFSQLRVRVQRRLEAREIDGVVGVLGVHALSSIRPVPRTCAAVNRPRRTCVVTGHGRSPLVISPDRHAGPPDAPLDRRSRSVVPADHRPRLYMRPGTSREMRRAGARSRQPPYC
ncbi:hypothetical protein [Alloactinosynnema sp. L-07]|nr:hypothetical protein [Alloactinosynnema sp. L-07]